MLFIYEVIPVSEKRVTDKNSPSDFSLKTGRNNNKNVIISRTANTRDFICAIWDLFSFSHTSINSLPERSSSQETEEIFVIFFYYSIF